MKIFISVYPFGEADPAPLYLLKNSNFQYKINPFQRKLKPEETCEMALDCDGIIAGTESLTPLIEKSQRLKIISRVGVGLDSVPLELCRKKGIRVTNTPDSVTPAVVELTMGVMINICRFVPQADRIIREGGWKRFTGKRIGDSVIGIIGAGRVGGSIIKILSAFQPKKILINDIVDKTDFIDEMQKKNHTSFAPHERGTGEKSEIKQTSKEEIFKESDIVSIHTPLTEKTKNMINKESLNLFKKSAFLINQARGGIVNEDDLYECLKENKLGGAALDVFQEEPYAGKLTKLDNILLTAHMGSCSIDCRIKMETEAAQSILNFSNNL